MILPNTRASIGPGDIETLLQRLSRHTGQARRRWEGRFATQGLDYILDHPETFAAVWGARRLGALSPKLTFYVIVRHTLLESGVTDARIADYIAALLIEFASHGRAYRIAEHDDKSYIYLVDLVADLESECSDRRQFLLRAHIGNYALWLSGLFPDFVIARVHRRAAPGLDYYESVGSSGYLTASEFELANRYDLRDVFRQVASSFGGVRRALNRISDRHFFPVPSSQVDRLLRQVIDGTVTD
ncbi:MAG: hypothetical protein PVJ43_11965 [Gemmatimonadales bacterium]|jgi:hypothetical protein